MKNTLSDFKKWCKNNPNPFQDAWELKHYKKEDFYLEIGIVMPDPFEPRFEPFMVLTFRKFVNNSFELLTDEETDYFKGAFYDEIKAYKNENNVRS